MDIWIVIPAHQEGEGIARTIASIWWASRNLTEQTRIGVFVVINNRQWADAIVTSENRRTSELLRTRRLSGPAPAFCNQKMSSLLTKQFPAYAPANIQKGIDLCEQNGIDIQEIDLWSESKSLTESNVGIARHQGFMEAKQEIWNGGTIISLDADTMINAWYLRSVQESILLTPNKVSYWPRLSIWYEKDREILLKTQQNMFLVEFLEYLQMSLLLGHIDGGSSNTHYPREYKISWVSDDLRFEWCNIIIPAHLYEGDCVFPPISGEEDTYLCNAMKANGIGLNKSENWMVLSHDRISQRTTTGEWTYNAATSKWAQHIRVRNLAGCKMIMDIADAIVSLDKEKIRIAEIENILPDHLKIYLPILQRYVDKEDNLARSTLNDDVFSAEIGRLALSEHNVSLLEGFTELETMVSGKKWQPFYGIKKEIQAIKKYLK